MDSSVTLPNASVTDGLRKTSELASARARSSPVMLTDEDRLGQLFLEPWPRRPVADDQRMMLEPVLGEGVGPRRRRRRGLFP